MNFIYNFDCSHNYLSQEERKNCYCFDNWLSKSMFMAIEEQNMSVMLKLEKFLPYPIYDYFYYACQHNKADICKFLISKASLVLDDENYLKFLEKNLLISVCNEFSDMIELLIVNGASNISAAIDVCKSTHILDLLKKYF